MASSFVHYVNIISYFATMVLDQKLCVISVRKTMDKVGPCTMPCQNSSAHISFSGKVALVSARKDKSNNQHHLETVCIASNVLEIDMDSVMANRNKIRKRCKINEKGERRKTRPGTDKKTNNINEIWCADGSDAVNDANLFGNTRFFSTS